MAIRWMLAALALFGASPALADTTAVYSMASGEMTMTVQIASNGDVRTDMGGKMLEALREKMPGMPAPAAIARGEEFYFVQPGPDGLVVIRVSDAVALMGEYLKQHPLEKPATAPSSKSKLVARGPATVNGRDGTAYAPADESATDRDAFLVLSSDPDLAELRDAMARHFAMSLSMGSSIGMWNGNPGGNLLELLRTGAPLRLSGMELIEVKHEPIPADRFELPAAPLSREALRALMTPKDSAP